MASWILLHLGLYWVSILYLLRSSLSRAYCFFPSCHRARGRVWPGQVTSLLQDQHRKTGNHLHLHSHLLSVKNHQLTALFFDCGYPERSYAGLGRICTKRSRSDGALKPTILWGNSANQCTAVLPHFPPLSVFRCHFLPQSLTVCRIFLMFLFSFVLFSHLLLLAWISCIDFITVLDSPITPHSAVISKLFIKVSCYFPFPNQSRFYLQHIN